METMFNIFEGFEFLYETGYPGELLNLPLEYLLLKKGQLAKLKELGFRFVGPCDDRMVLSRVPVGAKRFQATLVAKDIFGVIFYDATGKERVFTFEQEGESRVLRVQDELERFDYVAEVFDHIRERIRADHETCMPKGCIPW